jgi:hypothetical protein
VEQTTFYIERIECCVMGQEHLEEHRLKPDSPTRRVIATCCNSGMFLDFTKGHWLAMYRNRFPAGAPPLEMRVMTQHRRDGVELADDLPNYDSHSGKFMLGLIAAWIAMGLRRPEITLGKSARKPQCPLGATSRRYNDACRNLASSGRYRSSRQFPLMIQAKIRSGRFAKTFARYPDARDPSQSPTQAPTPLNSTPE